VPRIDGREVVLDVTSVTVVSLAVALVDGYTNGRPIGRVKVLLVELSREGRVNPSGYFLFLNIPDGIYTLRAESEHYLDEELALSLPTSPPQNPLVTLALQPRPSYPFPPGATLIRGLVQDAAKNPVAGAHVDVVGKDIHTRSGENGEFVLYFHPLREQDIVIVNRRPFVKADQSGLVSPPLPPTLIRIRANHPRYGTVMTIIEVQEGTTAFVMLVY
jgi:hypothetical protein